MSEIELSFGTCDVVKNFPRRRPRQLAVIGAIFGRQGALAMSGPQQQTTTKRNATAEKKKNWRKLRSWLLHCRPGWRFRPPGGTTDSSVHRSAILRFRRFSWPAHSALPPSFRFMEISIKFNPSLIGFFFFNSIKSHRGDFIFNFNGNNCFKIYKKCEKLSNHS